MPGIVQNPQLMMEQLGRPLRGAVDLPLAARRANGSEALRLVAFCRAMQRKKLDERVPLCSQKAWLPLKKPRKDVKSKALSSATRGGQTSIPTQAVTNECVVHRSAGLVPEDGSCACLGAQGTTFRLTALPYWPGLSL